MLFSRIRYVTYIRAILGVVIRVPYFVEVVLVKLPHKAGEIAMLEVLRQYLFGEAIVLDRVLSQSPGIDCGICGRRSS